jgi:hypothetical protein
MYEVNKDTEVIQLREVDMTADNYIRYFGSLLMLNEVNNNYEFLELINTRFAQGAPKFSHYFMKQTIQKASGHKVNIDFTNYQMPLPTTSLEQIFTKFAQEQTSIQNDKKTKPII